jgi:ferredoxin
LSLQIAANCTGCGRCVAACRQHALTLSSADANGMGRKIATVTLQRGTGCGACLPACQRHALSFLSS